MSYFLTRKNMKESRNKDKQRKIQKKKKKKKKNFFFFKKKKKKKKKQKQRQRKKNTKTREYILNKGCTFHFLEKLLIKKSPQKFMRIEEDFFKIFFIMSENI